MRIIYVVVVAVVIAAAVELYEEDIKLCKRGRERESKSERGRERARKVEEGQGIHTHKR